MGQGRVGHNGMRTDVTGWGRDVTGAGMSWDEDEGWDGIGVETGRGLRWDGRRMGGRTVPPGTATP